MNRTWKKTVTTILAFALATGGMIGGASYYGVSAAEQPVTAFRDADEPAEMAIDAGVYEANAGDTIKVKVKATDIKDSFNAINGYLRVNTDAFTVLSVTPGDTDDPNNGNTGIYENTFVAQYDVGENTELVGFIYCDLASIKEDVVLFTVELKVNDDAKDGCYAVPFDLRGGNAMASKIVDTEDGWGDVLEVNPDFRGALITVGAGSDEVIQPGEDGIWGPEYTEEPEYSDTDYHFEMVVPENYTYTEEGQPITSACSADEEPAFVVDAGIYDAKAGDTVKVKIKAADIKKSFGVVVGYLIVNTDQFTILSVEPGDTDDPNNEITDMEVTAGISAFSGDENCLNAAFVYSNTEIENVDEEMVFATVELKVNDDLKDGSYELPFAVLEYGGMAARYGSYDDVELEPEYHGAIIKVNAASEETTPEEQGEEAGNQETPSTEENPSQTEVSDNEEPEKPEEHVSDGHHHNHHENFGPHHGHGHGHGHNNGHGHGYDNHSSGSAASIGQKIVEEITNAISNIAKYIISLF